MKKILIDFTGHPSNFFQGADKSEDCLYLQLVYFQEWLPNELSSILIEDFTSAKDLADHLHHLHRNDYEYLAYLRQKPSINDNRLSRISNDFLIQAMNLRSWGVSDKDQLTEGT